MPHAYETAKSIVQRLTLAGHTAYFAGGWVRDFVMGHPSEDIDIATDAQPAEIMDLFPQTILVGLSFGVVIVVVKGEQFEVATFRRDLGYVDGRRPTGIEATGPVEDAMRRDFTINGMFYDPIEEKILDYVHGREDITKGVIRTIGDPHERFFEDRLRMLRAFRFAARFSFSIELETQEAIREHADKFFPAVAMERVWQEFNKMAAYPRFDQAIVEMHRLGLLDQIFPEIASLHIHDLRGRVSSFPYLPKETPPILFLMEIFVSHPLSQRMDVAKRLKSSNEDIKLVEYIDQLNSLVLFEREGERVEADPVFFVELFANDNWKICMQVLAARYLKEKGDELVDKYALRYLALLPHIERKKKRKPLVTAAMLQKKGIAPGKEMGRLLKEAEEMAIRSDGHDPEKIIERLLGGS